MSPKYLLDECIGLIPTTEAVIGHGSPTFEQQSTAMEVFAAQYGLPDPVVTSQYRTPLDST